MSLVVLIIFAIVSALIQIYVDLEILNFFGIPLDFRFFLFGVFTILYGIFIYQLIRLTGILKRSQKASKRR